MFLFGKKGQLWACDNTAPLNKNYKLHPKASSVGAIWNSAYVPPCLSFSVCCYPQYLLPYLRKYSRVSIIWGWQTLSFNNLLEAVLGVEISKGLGVQSKAFNHT